MDVGEFALELGEILEHCEFIQNHNWTILALDIGEITIMTGDGEEFRLVVYQGGDDEQAC